MQENCQNPSILSPIVVISQAFRRMKIALIGYGKMGLEIEKIALQRGHVMTARATADSPLTVEQAALSDVAIEFTGPDSAAGNIRFCFANELPVVVGSTGWYAELNQLKSGCEKSKGAMLYASNFSIGVNMFFALNKVLASLMSKTTGYSASMQEIHHTQKKDSPSGTAVTLAEQIIQHFPMYKSWVNVKKSEDIQHDILPIESLRLPDVPGTHSIVYGSEIDEIEIKHTAHNRSGFALGSVIAAEWLNGKRGVYTFDEVLKF